MMKKTIFLLAVLTALCSYVAQSQTSNLVYSLGKASSTIEIMSIATDAGNNIYICGSFTGSGVDFNPLGTAVTKSSLGGSDGFIAKYNSAGELAAVNIFGNGGTERANKIFVNATGVYMLATVSAGIIKFDPSDFGTSAGSGAMALVKYNDQLVLQKSILVNKAAGATGDMFNDIKVVGSDIYVTGLLTNTAVEFNPLGTAKILSPVGFTDIFIAKYDASLICQFAYNVGGADGDAGRGIDVDGAGNIYVTGFFRGQGIDLDPTGASVNVYEVGEAEELAGAVGDAFVAKYNASMVCQWGINIGAASADQGTDILVTSAGTVYVGGIVKDDILPADFNTANPETNVYGGHGLNDIFVASYTTAGIYNWHLATGSTGQDDLAAMAFDVNGNIVITGFTGSGTVNFGNSKTITGLGGTDVYFATISPAGTALSVYNEGGSGNEQGNGIAVTSSGNILVAGNLSASGDYDPTASPAGSLTLKGVQDGFIARYGAACTAPVINTQPVNEVACQGTGASFSVAAAGATSYQWYKNGAPLSGATASTYSISSATAADAATYKVDVINTCQTVISNTVSLTVDPAVITPVISDDQTLCSGSVPDQIEGAAAAGGAGTATAVYKWESSANGTSGWATISSATSKDFTPGTLTATTYYRRSDTKGSCAAAVSNVIKITVDPTVTTPVISDNQILCSGSVPDQIGGAATAGGATTATAVYKWESSANGTSGWVTISSATSKDFTPGTLTATTYYRRSDTKGACAAAVSNVIKITVDPTVSTPVISADQTVCSGSAPVQIGGAAAAGGSGTAAAVYKWESSATGLTGWATISGATSKDYTPGASTATTYYRRSDTKGACAAAISNVIKITVDPVVTTPVISADQTICSGATPNQIGGTAAAGGSTTATAVYKWESSATGTSVWTAISGATLKDYTPGALTSTTYYRRSDTKGLCAAAISNVIKITVDPAVTSPVITADQTICSGSAPAQLTGAAAAGGSTSATVAYTWESSVTGTTGWTIIAGATSKDYSPGTLTATRYYRRTDTKGVCMHARSNAIEITVDPVVTPSVSISTPATTICTGASVTFNSTATNGGNMPTYQWKKDGINISGETNASYTTTTAINGNSYSVAMTSTELCKTAATVPSNNIVLSVTASAAAAVTIDAEPGNAVCAGTSVTFTATPANGGTAPTYEWFVGTVSQGAPSTVKNTFTSSTLTNGSQVKVKMVSNSSCASPTNAESLPITMTVTPAPTVAVSLSADKTTICANEPVVFTANSSTGGTSPTYVWKNNNVIIAGQNGATYTTSTLAAGNAVKVEMSSNALCASTTAVPSNTVAVTVNPVKVPTVSISTVSTTICAGTSITFNASVTNQGTTPSYKWKMNNAVLSGATGSSYSTTEASDGDVYSVELTSNAACAVPATVPSNELTMHVNDVTAIDVQPAGQSICALGNTVTFSVSASGTNLVYKWRKGTVDLLNSSVYSGVATKDLTISNITASELATNYNVVITGTCGSVTSANTALSQTTTAITIITQPEDQTVVTGGIITLSVAASGPSLTYQWKRNNTNLSDGVRISGSQTAILTITNAQTSDNFSNYVCVISSPCATQKTTNTASVVVSTATSIQSAQAQGFSVIPNPSSGLFVLVNESAPFTVETIEIVSMQGVVVTTKNISATSNISEEIHAQDLPSGMYLLIIKGEGQQALLKIAIDK